MQIVNSTDVTSNLRNPETNETITTVPGRLVEMTYSTNFTPNEINRGHFVLFATNATAPNPGETKGYSVFYEGNSTTTATPAEITTAAAALPLPAAVGEVFDSFELIAAPGVAQADDDDDDDDDDNGGDDDDNGGDDDDNGGDDDENSGEEEQDVLENCEVSPGGDPLDDCDFRPDAEQALTETAEGEVNENSGEEEQDVLENCEVSPGGDPLDDCDFRPDVDA
jgi:hypothetical protein